MCGRSSSCPSRQHLAGVCTATVSLAAGDAEPLVTWKQHQQLLASFQQLQERHDASTQNSAPEVAMPSPPGSTGLEDEHEWLSSGLPILHGTAWHRTRLYVTSLAQGAVTSGSSAFGDTSEALSSRGTGPMAMTSSQ